MTRELDVHGNSYRSLAIGSQYTKSYGGFRTMAHTLIYKLYVEYTGIE
jgi:hypothetical protein